MKITQEFPKTFESVLFSTNSLTNEVYMKEIYDILIKNLVTTMHLTKKRIDNMQKKFNIETTIEKTKEEEKIVLMEVNDDTKKKWVECAQLSNDITKVAIDIIETIGKLSNSIFQLWNQYLNMVIIVPYQLAMMLRENFNKSRSDIFRQYIRRTRIKVTTFPFLVSHDVSTEQIGRAHV